MSDKELEETITAVALRNDDNSFKKLYFFYFNGLYHLAISMVKSAEDAEEIVNDVFLSIWNNRAQLTQVRNFKFYIYAAVRNKSINVIAHNKPYQHIDIEDAEVASYPATENSESKVNTDDLARVLNHSIAKLPAQSRLIFRLVKQNGFKHKEVAELLGLSVKSIEYHIGSALKKIWETFADAYDTGQKKIVKK